MTTGHSSKDEGSCGQRIANMICMLPKGHSGLHDDLDDAASNRMRLIDAEQELVAKNNRIAALERENAELKKDVQLYRDLCRASQSDHERVALENKSLRRLPHEPLWRPIAQAPRDGTWVLVAHKCYGLPVVARWHDGDWLSSSNERGLLVDKWSTLPDVQDTRASSETGDKQ